MDVVVELGHEQQRRVPELAREPRHVALVAPGQHVVVVEVLGHPRRPGRPERARAAPPQQILGVGVAQQVVVEAVDDHARRTASPLPRSVRPNQIASSIGSRWAEVTTRNAVVAALQHRLHGAAPGR